MDKLNFNLSLLKIPVNEVEASANFYANIIGFEQQFVAPEYGWAHFQAGDLQLGLYQPGLGGGNRTPGGSVDFHLTVSNLEGLEARLQQNGVNIFDGIVKSNDGLDFLEVEDPSGNILKFIRG